MIGNGHAGFGRAASEKDPQGHLADVVPRHTAIPARLRRNGPGNGFAKRCAHGKSATALRRPRTTGRARTHAGAAAKRSNDYTRQNGPHRPPSPICTAAGRRPAPTPSAATERPGHNAVVTRTLALRLVICERGRRRSPRTPRPFVCVAATRPSAPGDCWARGATATCACKPPRIGPPASTSTTLAIAAKQAAVDVFTATNRQRPASVSQLANCATSGSGSQTPAFTLPRGVRHASALSPKQHSPVATSGCARSGRVESSSGAPGKGSGHPA